MSCFPGEYDSLQKREKGTKENPTFYNSIITTFFIVKCLKHIQTLKAKMTNTNTSRVEDFPNHHIGPRRHEAKAMLQTLGYNVSNYQIEMISLISTNFCHHL